LGRRALQAAGAGLGGLFGPIGTPIGVQGANWLSDVLGMGDYEVKNNSLMNSNSGVPTFSSSKHSVRLRHREFLGDITGSTAFSVRDYSLNPGDPVSFPWLSGVAERFQQYKFHGLLFEFVSTSADALNSTNTALGTVVMATKYSASQPAFTSKAEMEQYEFSCSTRPCATLIHPVECDPAETVLEKLYVRSGALSANQDSQFFDLGTFYLATVGMQAAATIGELWVTYDVEMYKPRINPGGLFNTAQYRVNNGPYDANNILGTLQTVAKGAIPCSISATGAGFDSINFPAEYSSGRFFVFVNWRGAISTATTVPTVTLTNLTGSNFFALGAFGSLVIPDGGAPASTQQAYVLVVTINGYNAAGSKIQFSGGTRPVTPSSVDIVVLPVPLTDSHV